MTKFSSQCGRCGGSGKYDRGTCFECKGNGFINSARKPNLPAHNLVVTYSNGSTNNVTVHASQRRIAVEIVECQLRINGWQGAVA